MSFRPWLAFRPPGTLFRSTRHRQSRHAERSPSSRSARFVALKTGRSRGTFCLLVFSAAFVAEPRSTSPWLTTYEDAYTSRPSLDELRQALLLGADLHNRKLLGPAS